MPKIRPGSPKRKAKVEVEKEVEQEEVVDNASGSRFGILIRPRVWFALLFLLGLGFAANGLWRFGGPLVARLPQYRLTVESIRITPPPPWVRANVKAQVLGSDPNGTSVSVLENFPELAARLKHAFEQHPWVESVEQITRRVPAALDVQIRYRQPIAAVESSEAGNVSYLPIDRFAVRLPDADLTDAERRRLPRISGINTRPPLGHTWNDPRVTGGAKLIASLTDVWQKLMLVEVLASPNLTHAGHGAYTFELVTKGGTRIVWGAEPGQETSSAEKPFALKRQQLLDYAVQHGNLEMIDGPESIDVRRDFVITPRTARAKPRAVAK